ncbi:hypothetical protein ACOMHN_063476 [Nucella lapillus]
MMSCVRAVDIAERALGRNHPNVATVLTVMMWCDMWCGLICGMMSCVRAVDIAERALGRNHPNVATVLTVMMWCDMWCGVICGMMSCVRAVDIAERALGRNHPNVATVLTVMMGCDMWCGVICCVVCGVICGMMSCVRAVDIAERALGRNHPNVATVLTVMMGCDMWWDMWCGVICGVVCGVICGMMSCVRAVDIAERALGRNHPNVATVLTVMMGCDMWWDMWCGVICGVVCGVICGMMSCVRAVDIAERALGRNHPNVATVLTVMMWAVDIAERALGRNHPNVATVLTVMMWCDMWCGVICGMMSCVRAVDIAERALGRNHPNVATVLTVMMWCDMWCGVICGMMSCVRAVDIAERALGRNHPNVATVLTVMMGCDMWWDMWCGVICGVVCGVICGMMSCVRAVDIAERALGRNHPNVATVLTVMMGCDMWWDMWCGVICGVVCGVICGMMSCVRAVDIAERALGRNHPNVATVLTVMMGCDMWWDMWCGVICGVVCGVICGMMSCVRAVDIAERALGRNHPNVATVLTNLGTLEVNRNNIDQAEKYLTEAVDIYKACQSPPTNSDYFKSREKLVYTLVKADKHQQALAAFTDLYSDAKKAEVSVPLWPTMWAEVMSLLFTQGQATLVSEVAMFVMTSAGPSDIMITFLDRADRACKRKESRPHELTVRHALQQNPDSHLLLAYQAQDVLIPAGSTAELLALLDAGGAALGRDLYHAAVGWCQAKGQDPMALDVLKHASDKFPDDVNLASQACGRLREQQLFEEALPYAHRLLSVQPEDVHVLLFAGEILVRNGQLHVATEVFSKAARFSKAGSPEHKQASSGLQVVTMMSEKKDQHKK